MKKWPRQMAATIMQQPTKEARWSMLMQVPGEWRELVKRHIENAWHRRGFLHHGAQNEFRKDADSDG